MIVTKPFEINSDTLTSSSISEPELSESGKLEYLWNPVKNFFESYSDSGIVDICDYKDGKMLGVDGTGNVYEIYEVISGAGTHSVRFDNLLFNIASSNFTSVTYYNEVIYIADQSVSSVLIESYEVDGTNIGTFNPSYGNQHSVISNDNGKLLISNGLSGSSAKVALFSGSTELLDFDITGGTNRPTSIQFYNGSVFALYSSDNKIYQFEAYKDNSSFVDEFLLSSDENDGLCFVGFMNKFYTYDDNNTRFIRKNIILDDDRFWWAGDIATLISTHKKYICITSGTYYDPLSGSEREVPTWEEIGATNRYKMFDLEVSSPSYDNNSLSVTLNFDKDFDSIAIFNISGDNLSISHNGSSNNYDVSELSELVLIDFEGVASSNLIITLSKTSSEVSIGEMLIGKSESLGEATYPIGLSLKDFSKVEVDDFGNTEIIKRRNAKVIDYGVVIDKNLAINPYNTLKELTTVPCLYSDDSTDYAVIAYYKNLSLVLDNPAIAKYSLKVEEIV